MQTWRGCLPIIGYFAETTNAEHMRLATTASSTGLPSQIWRRIRALVIIQLRVESACPQGGGPRRATGGMME
jgi:hypothetical protein